MTNKALPSRRSRRSMLGLLGASPVVAGGLLTLPNTARAAAPSRRGGIPHELRPGGEYDQYVAHLAAKGEFSGVVVLAHRGRPVLQRACGMANRAESIPNRLDTRFDLGSITKTFTAVAVMQLAERGKIEFHETVGTYLEGFWTKIADKVTVHQLLTHTSGMGDYFSPAYFGRMKDWRSEKAMFEGTLNYIRKLPYEPTLGAPWTYSNAGYHLLGAIVAAVSEEKDYYTYVRNHIFAPAEMGDTDFYHKPEFLPSDAFAHQYAVHPETGKIVDALTLEEFPYVGVPAGFAFSTAGDMLKFACTLRQDGKLLGSAWADLATGGKAVILQKGKGLEVQNMLYGYGFIATMLNDQRIRGHAGNSTFGVHNMFDFYPDLDWVSLIFCNVDKGIYPMVNELRDIITKGR